MCKVTFGVANSLDNYIARKDESVDWLKWSKDVTAIMEVYWKTIDTVVWGRKTYDFAVRSGGGSDSYPGITNYVLSRTLTPGPDKSVTIIREDAATFIRKLKRKKGKDICLMCGGNLAKSLFEAKVIDEIGFNIHPVLLGSGIPLFHAMKRQIDLELLECRALKGGCVYVRYRVKK